VLRDYFATVPPELTDEGVHQLLSNFAHLVPEIRQMLPDLPDPPPLEPQQEQLRLMTSLTQFIKQATQERPWLLVLDDLQWADQSSLELLRYLGRHLPSMALMIIGVYSEAELDRDHPLLETLRDLRSHPTYRHIPLNRLDQETVGQVLANIWQQSVPEVLVEKIYQHTEGNPFYVEEVAKGLSDDGLVTLQEGEWRFPALEEVRLPQTVREVVWRRIRHLSPDTQALLRQAAVLGQAFKFDDLQEISGLSEWEVLEQLDMALERQLVQEVAGDTMLRFSHPEIHYVLYAELGPLRRRLLHRQAGEALERRAMPEPERIAEELAHHFREAGELEKALIYSIHAAHQTEASYANEAALLWYNRTLEMLDQLSPEEVTRIEETHGFRSLRASAYQSLGDVLSLTGQYDEALAHYASARVLVEAGMTSAEQGRRLANLCLQTADVHDKRSEYFNALTWLDKGLGYLDEDEPTIEAAHIYLLRAEIYRRQGKNEEAIDWCQRSLDIASQIKTREGQQAMGHAYYALGATHWRRGDLERAVQFCRESVRVYRKIDDLVGQSNAYNHLANVYHDRGEWAQASDAHNRNLAIRQEIGDIYGEGLATHNLAGIYLDSGEWTRAAELYEQSLDIWTQVGAILPEATTLSNLAQVYIYQESWSEAHVHLSRSQALFVEIGSEEYLAELDRRWGEYYLGTGELEMAMAHTRRSIELAVVQGNPIEEGVSCRMLGLVHLARGEMEPAEAVLHQSLQILSDLNSEYEAARTRLALARLALETGSTDEVETYLTPAIETFEKLGAKADLAKARELEGRL
jgi:predicted ATPase